ncbi:hypothetical protein LTR78_002150 [Recurvomyces mirabilis]|uniref:NECAP PHear domain-containing protein n=1 Tax=Recurvomyces mirabilis TaxID=574656 RepID=A0AAE0WTU9_9PEZI|nr:hypothetical protein LTR78_002150 [Recurvomyces mirabilis]KAK5160607.1 hypothetical protein LTS14_001619 [Recurvomyces mirabilis]
MIDPATGRTLPESDTSYQRILFVTPTLHVYGIPPLSSNRGFSAGTWTSPTQPTAQEIFTGRLRIVETTAETGIKVDIVIEDPNTGDLFAAAPYTSQAVVQQANDSSRFFAVRVQGEGGMKATLGIGFEDRSPAFDFSIALTEARKVLGFEAASSTGTKGGAMLEQENKQDFSLKEGEKIHIQVGSKGRRAVPTNTGPASSDSSALFSIAPPPAGGKSDEALPAVAPPPQSAGGRSAQELGFDDGEFGEFQ